MLLIDGDTPCYAAAIVHEEDGEQQAIWEANTSIERLLKETNSSQFKLYLTGDNNFRYNIFPEYKAFRLKKAKPRHLRAVQEAVLEEWHGILSDGCEADDLIGIEQTANYKANIESVICTIDKDLDQIAGWHYHPGIRRKGEWIREPKRYVVSPNDALYFFYYQLLIGDPTDGIKGAVNIGPVKARKILDGCETEEDYYWAVEEHFSCKEELIQNAQCIKIQTYEGERWVPPMDRGEAS